MAGKSHLSLVSLPRKAEVDPEQDFQEVTAFRLLVVLVAALKRL